MREIKFRGKDYKKEWIFGNLFIDKDGNKYIISRDYLELDGHHLRCDSDYPVFTDDETVGQYTGIKDKNGKEIYEGDIVKISQWNLCPSDCGGKAFDEFEAEVGSVIFAKGRFFAVSSKGCSLTIPNILGGDLYYAEKVEVIGNIYDNKDLLEGDINDTQA